MNIDNIAVGKDVPESVNVIIEIPAQSDPVKYEVDKESGALMVDRFMSAPMFYPANYGFVPHTLSEDGDPVDVLVVTPAPLVHGCVIPARPVGVLNMEDESGVDAKIVAVPAGKLAPQYKDVVTYTQLPALLLDQIKHFFEHYKELESGKWVKVGDWGDAEAARQEILASVRRYQDNG
ncbi:MAG: inorganic diphosphatase [Thiothrix sp.]|nr:inorganic diphosphatase [Thiothrix sp.]HPQ94405.1 inorganic diphosphatase [Thiolinea sp.]